MSGMYEEVCWLSPVGTEPECGGFVAGKLGVPFTTGEHMFVAVDGVVGAPVCCDGTGNLKADFPDDGVRSGVGHRDRMTEAGQPDQGVDATKLNGVAVA